VIESVNVVAVDAAVVAVAVVVKMALK